MRRPVSVVGIADNVAGKAAQLATESSVGRGFDSVAEAVRFAPGMRSSIRSPCVANSRDSPAAAGGSGSTDPEPMGERWRRRRVSGPVPGSGIDCAVNFQLRYAPNNLAAVALRKRDYWAKFTTRSAGATYTPWQLWTFLAKRLGSKFCTTAFITSTDPIMAWKPTGDLREDGAKPPVWRTGGYKNLDDSRLWAIEASVCRNQPRHDFPETQCSFAQWEGPGGAIRIEMA